MLIATLTYAALGLALGIWAATRVRRQQDALELLLIATGMVAWWPVVVVANAAYELREWRRTRRIVAEWDELTANDDDEEGDPR
jgi:hypothetical protein